VRSGGALRDDEDVGRGRIGVEAGDEGGAAIEDGALVQVALVGDFAGVGRWLFSTFAVD
jgi:hypothetical protein